MAFVGNLLWFTIGFGWLAALLWIFMGCLLACTIIGIPFAVAAFRIANYVAFPFGRELVDAELIGEKRMVGTGFANFIWIILAGFWLALYHAIVGVVFLCGFFLVFPIFWGLANFKIAGACFAPLGKRIVPKQLAEQAQQRATSAQLDKKLGVSSDSNPQPATMQMKVEQEREVQSSLTYKPQDSVSLQSLASPPPKKQDMPVLVCPNCRGRYDDGKKFCPKDGGQLVPEGSLSPEQQAKRLYLEGQLAQAPNDPTLLHKLGDLFCSMGLYDDAQVRLFTALEIQPKSIELRRTLAKVFMKSGQMGRAAMELLNLAESNPDDANLWEEAADALREANSQKESVDAFLRACRVGNTDVGLLRRIVGKLDTIGTLPAIVEACRLLLNNNPEDTSTLEILGRHLVRGGQIKSAKAILEKLYQVDPQNVRGHLYLGIARYLYCIESNTNAYDAAQQMLDAALQEQSAFTEDEVALARLYCACTSIRSGDTDLRRLDAIRLCSALCVGPERDVAADACVAAANARLAAGDQEYALKAAETALSLKDRPAVREIMAKIHCAKGDEMMSRRRWRNAEQCYTAAISHCATLENLREKKRQAAKYAKQRDAMLAASVVIPLFFVIGSLSAFYYGKQAIQVQTEEGASIQIARFGAIVHEGQGPMAQTPLLRFGPYSLLVEQPGFYPTQETIWVTFGRNTRAFEVKCKPAYGSITVNSDPPGAKIIINGEERGITPATVEQVPARQVSLELHIENLGTYEADVSVLSDSVLDVGTIKIEANLGALKVDSNPQGADVYFDAKIRGTTPLELHNIAAGSYALQIVSKGGESYGFLVDIVASETTDLGTLDLSKTFFMVYEPKPDQKYVDRQYYLPYNGITALTEHTDGGYMLGARLESKELLLIETNDLGKPTTYYKIGEDSGIQSGTIKQIVYSDHVKLAALVVDDELSKEPSINLIMSRHEDVARGNAQTKVMKGSFGGVDIGYSEFSEFQRLCLTNDGSFLVASYSSIGSAAPDVFLKKYSIVGDLIWEKKIFDIKLIENTKDEGNLGKHLKGYDHFNHIYVADIKEDANGNIYVAGYSGPSSLNRAQTVPFLMKLKSNGEEEWTRQYPDISMKLHAYVIALLPHPSGYLMVCRGGYLDHIEARVMAVDWNGKALWQKEYMYENYTDSRPIAATQASNGDYLIAGTVDLRTDKPHPLDNPAAPAFEGHLEYAWLLRIDKDGNVVFSRLYGKDWEFGIHDILATADGGCCLSGYYLGPRKRSTFSRLALLKLDQNGMINGSTDLPDPTYFFEKVSEYNAPTTVFTNRPDQHTTPVAPKTETKNDSDDIDIEILADAAFYASQAAIETARKTGSVRSFLEKASSSDIQLWEKAAKHNDSAANWLMGTCYELGVGKEKNPEVAFSYYKKAAEAGFDVAQNDVGLCYLHGRGVEKNINKAVEWFRKAAEQGRPSSQYNLGRYYYGDWGGITDVDESRKWLQKSAAQGYEPARKYLQDVLNKNPNAQSSTNNSRSENKILTIREGYFLIGFSTRDIKEAHAEAKRRNDSGALFRAEVLDSSEWTNLQSGYYIVVYASYEDKAEAEKALKTVQSFVPDAYIKKSGAKHTNNISLSVASIEGKWGGTWQKTNGSSAIFTLFLSEKDNVIKAVGQAQGWTCWQVFEGNRKDDLISLHGVKVIKNSRPASVYELDILEMFIANSGTKLDGKWSDDSGSSGKLELSFSAREIDANSEIKEELVF